MSGLLFLTSDDFQLQRGQKGPILCCPNFKGISLILFYSTQCEHCQNIIPIFKRLPGSIGGCQFGMINVSNNKKCVMLSRETIAPIKVVPYILLYVNGRPYMRYNGPHKIEEIGRFVIEVSQKIQKNESTDKLENVKQSEKNKIPSYTIGKPLCGPDNKVCYLEFDSAYDNGKDNLPKRNAGQQLPSMAGMNFNNQ